MSWLFFLFFLFFFLLLFSGFEKTKKKERELCVIRSVITHLPLPTTTDTIVIGRW
jgi:hypothetical protein